MPYPNPMCYQPETVDMLLGVNIYRKILMSGVVRGDPGTPIAQQTHLGRTYREVRIERVICMV